MQLQFQHNISKDIIPMSAPEAMRQASRDLKALWSDCTGYANGANPVAPRPRDFFLIDIIERLDAIHTTLSRARYGDHSSKQLNKLANAELTMSSREIAERTGKRHGDVIRDIRVMFSGLDIDEANLRHLDNRGYTASYDLTKDLTLTLVSGYNVKLRHAIICRWIELERENMPPLLEAPEEVKAKLVAYEKIKGDDSSLGIRDVGRQLGVGQKRVGEILLQRKWACRQGRRLRPAYYGLEKKYVELNTYFYEDPKSGETKVVDNLRITRKGVARLGEILAR